MCGSARGAARDYAHLGLVDEVVLGAGDVRPAVEGPAGEVRGRAREVAQGRVVGEVIGDGGRVDVGADGEGVDDGVHPLAHEIDLGLQLAKALDVLAARHHGLTLPMALWLDVSPIVPLWRAAGRRVLAASPLTSATRRPGNRAE